MRFPFRRHRGSQTPQGSGFVTILPSDMAPDEFAENLEFILRHRRRPEHQTARQVITRVLLRSPSLSEDPQHAEALVSAIMLGLVDHGLEIVQSGEVE